MLKSKLLIIITGSIAAFKAVQIISKLAQLNFEIETVLSKSSLNFIGPSSIEGLTGKAPYTDIFEPGSNMQHIHLVRWADLVLVVPATANTINKMASGIGDDLLSTLFLAFDFSKPWILAPAMNTKMYQHPSTQRSLDLLKSWGIEILETESGSLACGEKGFGRLLEPDSIITHIQSKNLMNIGKNKTRKNLNKRNYAKRILITGGGTTEPIDAVRFISNSSTGQTSIKLAQACSDLGHDVTLVINNNSSISLPIESKNIEFKTFSDLSSILKKELKSHYDYVFHAAAVSDFHVSKINGLIPKKGKIASGQKINLLLEPNIKIISKLKSWSKNKKVRILGFKLTTHLTDLQIKEKVKSVGKNPNVDFVAQNDLLQIRTQSNFRFNLYTPEGKLIKKVSDEGHLVSAVLEEL